MFEDLDNSPYRPPAVVMSFPLYINNFSPNNAYMFEYSDEVYNLSLAYQQWTNLYRQITKEYIVYLLPPVDGLPDQTFCSNVAAYIGNNTIILSNFKSEPRRGEEIIARPLLEYLNYKVVQCPYFFEGEADLKNITGNVWTAGYGQRTELRTHHWLMDTFGLEIVSIKTDSMHHYHHDCILFSLSPEKALVNTSLISQKHIKDIEKHVEIVYIPKEYAYSDLTNLFKCGDNLLYGSCNPEDISFFNNLAESQGFNPVVIDLSQFYYNGAALSCFLLSLKG